jgi:hypothetical protein
MAPTKKRISKKELGIEMAAMAYVAMENGDYVYAKGCYRQYDEDHNPIPNQTELLRLAGYRGCRNDWKKLLGSNDQFWHFVELHRIRRTDPMFKIEKEKDLWRTILGDVGRLLYERLHYEPHSVSIAEAAKIGTMVATIYKATNTKPVDPGIVDELLSQLPEDQRQKAIEGMKANAQAEVERVGALERLG